MFIGFNYNRMLDFLIVNFVSQSKLQLHHCREYRQCCLFIYYLIFLSYLCFVVEFIVCFFGMMGFEGRRISVGRVVVGLLFALGS